MSAEGASARPAAAMRSAASRRALRSHHCCRTGEVLRFEFVADDRLRNLRSSDWVEALRVMQIGAWKACVPLCGGILEGILLSTRKAPPTLQSKNRRVI